GRLPGLVSDDRQRARLARATWQGAEFPRLQGHARRAPAYAAAAGLGTRAALPPADRGHRARSAAPPRAGAGGPRAGGGGRRGLAAPALDAPGPPRASRQAP